MQLARSVPSFSSSAVPSPLPCYLHLRSLSEPALRFAQEESCFSGMLHFSSSSFDFIYPAFPVILPAARAVGAPQLCAAAAFGEVLIHCQACSKLECVSTA